MGIFGHIWELPQDILGRVVARGCRHLHTFNGRKIYEISDCEGMSLGHYIFVNSKCPEGNLLRHEYGHCIQSRILGWLYLPVVGLSSLLWYRYFTAYRTGSPDSDYYRFWVEAWANRLSARRKASPAAATV